MSGRLFPIDSVEHGGHRHSAMRIECSKCDRSEHFVQNGSRHKPPEAAAQYFRHRGWRIGNGPRADVCPECQMIKPKPDLKVVKNMETAKAEPPREMGREERRIIFAKIDEIYLDDKSGYSPPWTDASVARDMGVPRSWVAQVREELFGPEGSNAEFDEFLEKAAPIITDLKNLFNGARQQLEMAKAIEKRIEDMGLERLAKRVEKEIGR